MDWIATRTGAALPMLLLFLPSCGSPPRGEADEDPDETGCSDEDAEAPTFAAPVAS